MAKRSYESLGELQRRVMDAVWELGEGTVQQVREHMGGELAYTTVLSVLQKLEKQGWLRHRAAPEGRAYVYSARKSRTQASEGVVRAMVDRVFGGDRLLLFQHLIDDRDLSPRELAELRRMIDERRKENRT